MKPLFLAAILFLTSAFSAAAQETPGFEKVWSMEIGVGLQPLHMLGAPGQAYNQKLADKGQSIGDKGEFPQAIDITGVMRSNVHTEFSFSLGASWYHFNLYQHPEFGINPDGSVRYNSNEKSLIGPAITPPVFSCLLQWRHIWNPSNEYVHWYSGLGLGFVAADYATPKILPVASVTPVALRIKGKHLYGYAEMMLGPLATLAHGGLGWRF